MVEGVIALAVIVGVIAVGSILWFRVYKEIRRGL